MRKHTAVVPRISRAATTVSSVQALCTACNTRTNHSPVQRSVTPRKSSAAVCKAGSHAVLGGYGAYGGKNILMLGATNGPFAALSQSRSILSGGTRFIGVYLARQLVEEGHTVTLLTRGKKPITFEIPDDTPESYARYAASVKHIAADRKDPDAMVRALSGQRFDGAPQHCNQRCLSRLVNMRHPTSQLCMT